LSDKTKILNKLRGNLLLFGKIILPKVFHLDTPEFHQEIADAVQNEEQTFINIIAPRGSAKSMVVGILKPLHHIFFDEGKKVVVLVSRTQGHAINLLQTIKDTLDYGTEFRQLFGYWGQHSAKKWASTEIVLKDGSAIICKGMGQQLRGTNIGGQRPSLIILDDPEDENNTKTSEAMEGNLRWALQSAIPSLDAQRGRMLVIGTPLHQRCLVLTLKDMKTWQSLHYSYLIEGEDGVTTSLWADMKSVKELLEEKAALEDIGRVSSFYKERLCQVIGDEDQLFVEDYFKFYDGTVKLTDKEAYLEITELEGVELKESRPINIFTGVDPASSTSNSADYSVIFNVGVDKDDNRFCLPYFRKRVKPMDLANAIIKNYDKYKATKTRIESVGYQEMLRDYVRRERYIPGVEIKENPRSSKSYRLESLQPLFASGRVYIHKDQRAFIDELLMYPRGKHDDLLDGFFYANKNVYKPFHTKKSSKPSHTKKYLSSVDWQIS